jgi:hypothetical protein
MRKYRRSHPKYNVKQKENFERFQAKNPNYFREYTRQWKKEHPKEVRMHSQEDYKRHPDRKKARNKARNIPLKEKCEDCGTTLNLEHHHPDYSKPTLTVTLCGKCNTKRKVGLK